MVSDNYDKSNVPAGAGAIAAAPPATAALHLEEAALRGPPFAGARRRRNVNAGRHLGTLPSSVS